MWNNLNNDYDIKCENNLNNDYDIKLTKRKLNSAVAA